MPHSYALRNFFHIYSHQRCRPCNTRNTRICCWVTRYLACTFLKAAASELNVQPGCLTFKDGALLTAINPKAWIMQIMMFSQFIDAHNIGYSVGKLTVLLAILNISGHIVWILFGSLLLARTTSILSQRLQNLIFSAMLFSSVILLL